MPSSAQQLTCSGILLLSPFLSATLSPTINYPFSEVSGQSFEIPGSVYTFPGRSDLAIGQFNVIERFASQLVANTKDLDSEVATALNEDFWLLYES
jgi:hypothetical protein